MEGIIITLGTFLLFFILEKTIPQMDKNVVGKNHDISNIGLGTMNLVIGRYFSLFTVFALAKSIARNKTGLLNMFDMDYRSQLIIGLVLLDALNYWWHRLVHSSSFLWTFHNIHHTDRLLNVSSALRFHVLEILMGHLFKLPFIILMGFPLETLLIYETILNVNVYFHHSNIRINRRLDHIISKVIITPYVHRIHHSLNLKKSHNFSSVLVLWDQIFGSFYPPGEVSTPKYGVPGYSDPKYQSFLYMLKQPFIGRK